jgi:hypothetical protein
MQAAEVRSDSITVIPFQIDYSKIFNNHPSCFWSNQTIRLTAAGADFLAKPRLDRAPQLMLLANTITLEDLKCFLNSINGSQEVSVLLESGTEPLSLSVALKNNLITMVWNYR